MVAQAGHDAHDALQRGANKNAQLLLILMSATAHRSDCTGAQRMIGKQPSPAQLPRRDQRVHLLGGAAAAGRSDRKKRPGPSAERAG